MKKRLCLRRLLFAAGVGFCFLSTTTFGESYDLSKVNGMSGFKGSSEAREMLQKNGFVVADPAFKQFFEPYIKSPMVMEPSAAVPRGEVLPSYITPDSAWDAYHFLLEEGVKTLEERQGLRLADFSRQLLKLVTEQKADADLVLYASVGLGLQDSNFCASLKGEAKQVVDGLKSGASPVTVPIGFSLAPQQFRAQSFYTQSPELSDYFAARQWYASVVFRVQDSHETKLAVVLAGIVDRNPGLKKLWTQLTKPYDLLLALPEDGSIPEYTDVAKSVLGVNYTGNSITDNQAADIQKRLENRLPLLRVNDQLLSRDEYAQFARGTRGFRLLAPRLLPCAVTFQNTVDPKIPNRMYPSGLDFLAASPSLRSPAAIRAVEMQFGKSVGEKIERAESTPLPDSVHGEAMQLLATLQKPLPAQVPAFMRSDAWSDLQLWTQLGAWAEQRHTWALHTKLSVEYMGIIEPPAGMVAPYPDFFTGLAALARHTADALGAASLDDAFEPKAVAAELLQALEFSKHPPRTEKDFAKYSTRLEQFNDFQNKYGEQHKDVFVNSRDSGAWEKLQDGLVGLAKRAAAGEKMSEADMKTLRLYFDCRENLAQMMKDFAPVCDRLAVLAQKTVAGEALTEDDAKWIENYGVTLATFHFYYGNSYEVPEDNFPIVTRVYSNPLTDSMLYAGLARPQALYLIIPNGGSLQLYRGAVMTYREFTRPNDQLLDDDAWREMVSKGQVPPAPPFTRSFCAETSVAELIRQLRAQSEAAFNFGDMGDLLWQIGSRATEKDYSDLLDFMLHCGGDERGELVEGMANIIAGLHWEPHRKELIGLLAENDAPTADAVARILLERPASLAPEDFITGFSSQPVRTRRIYCVIVSHLPPTDATRQFMSRALQDPADGVRWQAALAVGTNIWADAQIERKLISMLDDPNRFVAGAAAKSLAGIGATNAGPALLAKLGKAPAQTGVPFADTWDSERAAVMDDIKVDRGRGNAYNLLDPENLEFRVGERVPERAKKMESMRRPPMFMRLTLPTHDYTLQDALIKALGNLAYAPAADDLFKLRGTEYDMEAAMALKKIAPNRLADELLATAKNKTIDSYLREKALVSLIELSITNRARELVPLLDDETPIEYDLPARARALPQSPFANWRICDRAAMVIASSLGWENPMRLRFIRPEGQMQLLARAREWAKTAR